MPDDPATCASVSYETVGIDGPPGAELVRVRVDGETVPLGVHLGIADGPERIRAAHARWIRAMAARGALMYHLAALLGRIGEVGGVDPDAARMAPDGTARQHAIEAELIAAIAVGDPYRATRRIERAFRADGDDALYHSVRSAVTLAAEIEGRPDAILAAARALRKAADRPGSAMRGALDGMAGLPSGPDAPEPLSEVPGKVGMRLGHVTVVPDARPHGEAPVEIEVEADYAKGSAEFGADGAIEHASVRISLVFAPATWDPVRDGSLYGDAAVEAAVRALLRRRGLPDDAGWSESGRQRPGVGDMDADPALAGALWPELMSAERGSAPRPG